MPNDGDDDAVYDLAGIDRPAGAKRRPAAAPMSHASPSPKTIAYRTPPQQPSFDANRVKNFLLPLYLLIGGFTVEVVAATLFRNHTTAPVFEVGLQMIIGTALMLTALLIAAKFRSIELGSLRTALLKLAALSIAPAAVVDLLSPVAMFIPFGGIILFILSFVFYFALLGALFDLDESDTWYCVAVIFIVQVAVHFGVLGLMALLTKGEQSMP